MIPDSVTNIGEYAFNGCKSLGEIKIPDGVTGIGRNAFYKCTGLEKITLPGSLANIDSCVFYNCTSLTAVTIPNGITSIGSAAFERCTGLKEIIVPTSVTSIAESTFTDCPELTVRCEPDSYAADHARSNGIKWACIKHSWNSEPTIDKETSCTGAGSRSIHCAFCNTVDENTIETIPALSHKWKHYKKKGGYLYNGTEYDYCTVCKTKKNVKTLPGYAAYVVKGYRVKGEKKAFVVRWTKASTAAQKKMTRYEVRYSTKSNMSGAKYYSIHKSGTFKGVWNIKSNKKYYVQIRTYMKKDAKKYYSKWSSKKAVRTK